MTDTALHRTTADSTPHLAAYHALEEHFAELCHLGRALSLLSWDRAVMMPKTGAAARSKQSGTLVKIHHKKLTDEKIGDLLQEAATQTAAMSDWQNANLREMTRLYHRAAAVPGDLAAALSRTASACETKWEEARPENDFAAVEPYLLELLSLTRQSGQAIADACGMDNIYDAMLDEFDMGARYQDIAPLFSALEQWLPDAVNQAIEKQVAPLPLGETPPVALQEKLGRFLLKKMGYQGRFDTSSHPFSTGRHSDVRITTRYTSDDFTVDGVLTVMHEAGHGLYDMQVPEEWDEQPVGGVFDLSMAVHESQAMVWERQVGQSLPLWQFLAPYCRDIFGRADDDPAFQPENLYRNVNMVKKDLIRVEADEMTYPLHILLRTKLEKAMIDGDLEVKDLPAAWNDEMQDKFGITPPSDALGCMQDVHWYGGHFGYFPSYLLGAMNAAQVFQSIRRDIPAIDDDIAAGKFDPIRVWLRENIHSRGCLDMPRDIIKEATGDYLQLENFKNHLNARYLEG